MICPICGTDLGDSAFCDNCGTIVNAETGMQPEEPVAIEDEGKPARKRGVAIVGIAIAVIAIIVIVFAMQPRSGSDAPAGSSQGSTTAQGALPSEGSSTQSSSASKSASATSSNQTSSSSSSQSSGSSTSTINPADIDDNGNPTLHALIELNGAELQSLLQQGGFIWYEQASSWLAENGRLFSALNSQSTLSATDIDRIGDGGAGNAVIYLLATYGYASPSDAFNALAENVVVESDFTNDEALFAIVSSSSDNRYLVAVTTTNTNEQTVLLYTEEAVEQGLFKDTIGVDAGGDLDKTWETITR